jgi:hypothetical protein
MKLQIDTVAKTIKFDQTVKIRELINVLDKLLPKEWKDYSIETGSVIYWPSYQVIKYNWPDIYNPHYGNPYEITCGTSYVEIN